VPDGSSPLNDESSGEDPGGALGGSGCAGGPAGYLAAMTTYVVGVSGVIERGAGCPPPLAWAQAMAGDADQVIVVHAWEVPIVAGYEAVAAVDTTLAEDAGDEYLRTLLDEHGDERTTGRVVCGHPGQMISELVGDLEGDVTAVVGHGGSTKLSLLVGSTANYVIRHVRAPVVVVRGDVRLPVRRVVVGVDEFHEDLPDEPSVVALRWALNLPGVEQLDVQHAAFVPGVAAGPLSQPGVESEDEVDQLDAQLREAIDAAVGDDIVSARVVPVVTGGTGAFALIEASRDADLVVIGTRGHNRFVDLITGSTSLEVIAHAHCPVAVVR